MAGLGDFLLLSATGYVKNPLTPNLIWNADLYVRGEFLRTELARPFGLAPAAPGQQVDTVAFYASYRSDVHGQKFEYGRGAWAKARITF